MNAWLLALGVAAGASDPAQSGCPPEEAAARVPCLARFGVGPHPKAVAWSPDGMELWTALLAGPPSVEAYDTVGWGKLASWDLGQWGAVELAFSEDDRMAYASQMWTHSVFEIDRSNGHVRRMLPSESIWTKVVWVSPGGDQLWMSNWVGKDLSIVDLRSSQVVRKIATTGTPRGFWVEPDRSAVWVAGYGAGIIEHIALVDGTGQPTQVRTTLLQTEGKIRHLAVDPDRRLLYASDMKRGRIYRLDMDTGAVTELARTRANPNTIALSPDGEVLIVSCRGQNNPDSYYKPGRRGAVQLIDTENGRVLHTIAAGQQPTGLAISPDGLRFAWSDYLDNRVNVYGLPSTAVLREGGD